MAREQIAGIGDIFCFLAESYFVAGKVRFWYRGICHKFDTNLSQTCHKFVFMFILICAYISTFIPVATLRL